MKLNFFGLWEIEVDWKAVAAISIAVALVMILS